MLLAQLATTFTSLVMVMSAMQPGNGEAAPMDDSEAAKGRAAVQAWLKDLANGKPLPDPPKIAAVDETLSNVFPDDRFYTVRFIRYPRAVKPPTPLKLENLVSVSQDGSVQRIESLDALKKLFEKKAAEVQTEDQARAVLRACLRLAEEFYQDGYYVFDTPEQSISVVHSDANWTVSGKAAVTQGGKGEIKVSMTTGAPGNVAIEGKVRPDSRNR
jgi:hypothetical protein